MKKDFSTLYGDVLEMTSLDTGTDIMKHVRQIARKYESKIKAHETGVFKQDSSSALPIITEEIMRQRDILLKKSKSIAEANVHLNSERALDAKRLINENSTTIAELNSIRMEKKQYQRRVKELETKVLVNEMEKKTSILKKECKAICDTPYLRRKKGSQEQLYRLEHKKLENSLPPRMPRPERQSEYDRPEYVRKIPERALGDKENPSIEDEMYTGGPINPENSIPRMQPQSHFARTRK